MTEIQNSKRLPAGRQVLNIRILDSPKANRRGADEFVSSFDIRISDF